VDLTPDELAMLRFIAEAQDTGFTPAELARKRGMRLTDAGRAAIRSLEAKGLIERNGLLTHWSN